MPSILLTDTAKYYAGKPHQNASLQWLDSQLPKDIESQFAQKYRNNNDGSNIDLVNVMKFFIGNPNQIAALEWLQGQLPTKTLDEFATKWRAEPPKPTYPKAGSINWNDVRQPISEFFTVGEVTKGDPRRIPAKGSSEEKEILFLAKELDKIRRDWGSGLGVTSWFRPEPINSQVGGVSDSQHIYGRGVDIFPYQGDIFKFQDWLDANWCGALGYGAWKGFVHLDTRNGQGWKTGGEKDVRWEY